MGESTPKAMSGASVADGVRGDAASDAVDRAMDRYARGDDTAFGEVYRFVAPRLRGFLFRLAGDTALAEDLAHESLLRVHRARGNFAPGAPALPWIFAIARNAFLDHARRSRVARAAGESAAAAADGPELRAPLEAHGDEAVAARETLEVVRATLASLPVLQREAFVLLRFEGMSVNEAAQVLGATEAAVKVRAFRAYEALRAALAEYRGGKP